MRIGIDGRKIGDFGIGTYIRGLISGLVEIEPSLSLVVFVHPSRENLLPERHALEIRHESSPSYSLREIWKLGESIDEAKLDLFHAPHYVVPLTRTPFVVTIHDLIHLHPSTRHQNPLARPYAKWMIGRAVRESSAILTVSESVSREISARYPEAARKIHVTLNGIDRHFRNGARKRSALAGTRRYFLFVGNDKPHKNLDRLLEAFTNVRRVTPDVELLLVGVNPQRRRFSEGVRALGWVAGEELPSLYQHALALVSPSLQEGFGLPVVEAMAAGTAVIVADIPALREVAGQAAMIVDPLSSTSIAEAMIEVMDNPALRKRLVENGAARSKQFDWSRSARATLEIYRSVFSS